MKRLAMITLCLVMAVSMFAACEKNGQDTGPTAPPQTSEEPTETEGPQVGVPNPVVEVEGPEDFESLGVSIEAPDGAGEIRYFVIDNRIAEVQFKRDDSTYVYRAAVTSEDISGVYETFTNTEELKAEVEERTTTVTVKTTESGGTLAQWMWGDATYTLFTQEGTEPDSFNALALGLAQRSGVLNDD